MFIHQWMDFEDASEAEGNLLVWFLSLITCIAMRKEKVKHSALSKQQLEPWLPAVQLVEA